MTLTELKENYTDNPEYHKHIDDLFTQLVNNNDQLREHRDWCASNVFAMGEKSFWWTWKLICESLPENPKLCEIGVFKGGVISLWKMLRGDVTVYGITPLDGRGTGWTEENYASHIIHIHNRYFLPQPNLIIGGSEDEHCIQEAEKNAPFDIIYVDGNHSHDGALLDLKNYSPMVKSGGWLVVDDAACRTKQFFGVFQGIDTVCSALAEWEQSQTDFEFQFNVVHLMVYKRK